jgi:CheY-like chemotaxis protein
MPKRILVVAHDRHLRETRVRLMESEGYRVDSVGTDDEAMRLLESGHFDLVLLGRQSTLPEMGIDQRIRERFPELATLKIEIGGERRSVYPTRVTDSAPRHVIEALREMLGEDAKLIPVYLPYARTNRLQLRMCQ